MPLNTRGRSSPALLRSHVRGAGTRVSGAGSLSACPAGARLPGCEFSLASPFPVLKRLRTQTTWVSVGVQSGGRAGMVSGQAALALLGQNSGAAFPSFHFGSQMG